MKSPTATVGFTKAETEKIHDLAIAADTAELLLRKDYPAAAQSLRRRVAIVKEMLAR